MKVRIESIGSVKHDTIANVNSMDLLEIASKECLEKSKYISHDIDLILYAGIYRTDFLAEPAIAALLAKELDLNAKLQDSRRTFAFDVMNGALGFFNAIITGMNYISNGDAKVVMVATGEIDNNKGKLGKDPFGISESAATIIMEASTDDKGFGEFIVKNFVEEIDDRVTNLTWVEETGMSYLDHHISPDSEQKYLDCITKTVAEYMKKSGQTLEDFDVVIPPQISQAFCDHLEEKLFLKQGQMVNVFSLCSTVADQDFLSSSIPFALKEGIDQKMVKAGTRVLFISAGAGIQVACLSHQF